MRSRPAAVAAATLALVAAAAPAARAADPDPTPTLSIRGTGVTLVAPDVADVDLEVRSGSAQRETARSRANRRTRLVLAALARQGMARAAITTTGVTLSRTQVRRGKVFYAARNAISVHFADVAKVGPVVDAVTAAGVDTIDGPTFGFSDPSAGRAAATRAALADARRRADDAAAAAGQRITGVRTIAVDDPGDDGLAAYDKAAAASAPATGGGVPTAVSAGRREVRAEVSVTYTMAPA